PRRAERVVRGWNLEEPDPHRGACEMRSCEMRSKIYALAAALLLAAACAHDAKEAAAPAATPAATPQLPADVAQLAQPEKPESPAEESNPRGLAKLEPTGEFVSP